MNKLKLLAFIAFSFLFAGSASAYMVYAVDGKAMGYAYDTAHPLAGNWIGTGWSYNANNGDLGASYFLCSVDGGGYFACDAISRDKPTGSCVRHTVPFYGRMLILTGSTWNVAYGENGLYSSGLTALMDHGNNVTITTIAKPDPNNIMAGFIEHTTLVRTTYSVSQLRDTLDDYTCP
jgi:hypothetical protein